MTLDLINALNFAQSYIIAHKKTWFNLVVYAFVAGLVFQLSSPHAALAQPLPVFPILPTEAPFVAEADYSHPLLQEIRWQAADGDAETKLPRNGFPVAGPAKPRLTVTMGISAYTSRAAETDAAPCITASGMNVCERDLEDVVASNFRWLPFGTRLKIPALFGDREFQIQDRMNKRYTKTVDVWMKNLAQARQFGRRTAVVEIY